jgi:hypothetical protein
MMLGAPTPRERAASTNSRSRRLRVSGARETRVEYPAVHRERDDEVDQPRPGDKCEDRDVQDDRGKSLHQVCDASDQMVRELSVVACPGAERGAEQHRHADDDDSDDCGETRPVQKRTQDVDAVVSGAEPMRARWRLVFVEQIDCQWVVGSDPRAKEPENEEGQHDAETDRGLAKPCANAHESLTLGSTIP